MIVGARLGPLLELDYSMWHLVALFNSKQAAFHLQATRTAKIPTLEWRLPR